MQNPILGETPQPLPPPESSTEIWQQPRETDINNNNNNNKPWGTKYNPERQPEEAEHNSESLGKWENVAENQSAVSSLHLPCVMNLFTIATSMLNI